MFKDGLKMKIKISEVSKSFEKNKYIIKDISINIENKSFTTLLGPSGCGKTTLLRMLSGLETPDTGEIWFDEKCVFSKEKGINIPPEKRNIGFVFQDFALWPHMSVFENVAFGLRVRKSTEHLKEKVMEALRIVQLQDFADRYPSQLSGGQQQRVSFARAIALNPQSILFDEPLSALDALLREDMRTEIRKITRDMGITSVFVTHDQSEAMSMSDCIVVMNGGVIEQMDTPENVYKNPSSRFVAKFVGKSNWIDNNRMYRPEDICDVVSVDMENSKYIDNSDGMSIYEGSVISSQFMGDGYDIILSYKDEKWLMKTKHSPKVGEKLNIMIKNDSILSF